jgi:hypothetical protein
MATPVYWLTCCCWASRIQCLRPTRPPRKKAPRSVLTDPLAPSSAHDASARNPFRRRNPAPAVRCASLSRCCPARRDNLGTAAAALPLHPFHPAARSTIGGRSSPEPAKLTLPPATMSRFGARVIAFCYSLGGTRWSSDPGFLGRRSVLRPATLGTPSVYYGATTMSSRLPWAALRARLA